MADGQMTSDPDVRARVGELISEFCWRVDGGEGTRVAELFTADATLETPLFKIEGREAIHAWFSERADTSKRLSRHFWTNLRVGDDEAGGFVAHAYAMTVVGVSPAPAAGANIALGVSEDRIVIEGGRMLFAGRRLDLSFEGRIVAKDAA